MTETRRVINMKRCSLVVDSHKTLFSKTNRLPVLRLFAGFVGISLALGMAQAADDRTPTVPPALAVPEGNKVSFQVYATGVQIYVWTQSTTDPTQFSWVFKAPEAML